MLPNAVAPRPVNDSVAYIALWEQVMGKFFLESPAFLKRIEWAVRGEPLANAMVV